MASFAYQYLVKGVIDSHIFEDGGQQCFDQIPKLYHTIAAVFGSILFISIYKKFKNSLVEGNVSQKRVKKSSLVEILVGIVGIVAWVLTCYYKVMTGKGLFMLNPCHISILGVIVLCLAPSTPFFRTMHSMWTAWIYGANLALLVPHLEGISHFEVILYYLQHLIIVPIGPLILFPRFGYLRPTLSNQFGVFSSVGLYQVMILYPISALSLVNLNFALCHSPGDPFFPIFGKTYFLFGMFYLNLASYLSRWFYYILLLPLKYVWEKKQIHKNQ